VDVISWTRFLPAGQVEHQPGNPAIYRMGRFRDWDTTMPHTLNLLDWRLSLGSYQLVWGHYLTLAGFLAVWFARLNNLPSVVSIRGNDLDRDVFPPGDFARLQWTLGNATGITAVTRDLARKAQALSGRNDVVHLRNVVDSAKFFPSPEAGREMRERLGIGDNEAVLGFCGELREKKGLTHLIDALAAVRRVRPARLLVIGEVRSADRPRVPEDVLITGQIDSPEEVNAHLQACDVYLQPSLWDGMPNALLEAMAAGCGSIVSDAGGIPEIVTPGVEGVVLPRWQLHRLGEAILEWLDADPAHRQRVRCAARARVETEFAPESESQALQELISLYTATRVVAAHSQV
jgi:glycosyltransferase involved in cell wall biosynthesis